MPELKIVLYPDDPLTRRAEPVPEAQFGPQLRSFSRRMLKIMEASEGVGLAAPQVGRAWRMFVIKEPEKEPMVFVNPEILSMEGEQTEDEGCLSLPGLFGSVTRAMRVRVRARDPKGQPFELEAEGFTARIIQHEYDHLDGVVFLDRMDVFSREAALREWEQQRAALEAELPTPARLARS